MYQSYFWSIKLPKCKCKLFYNFLESNSEEQFSNRFLKHDVIFFIDKILFLLSELFEFFQIYYEIALHHMASKFN